MSVKILKLGQLQDTGFTMIGQLRNIFITCWIAAEVVNGNLTLGMMMSISAIIGLVNGPLSQLIGFLQQFQDAKINMERSEEVRLTGPTKIPLYKVKFLLMFRWILKCAIFLFIYWKYRETCIGKCIIYHTGRKNDCNSR